MVAEVWASIMPVVEKPSNVSIPAAAGPKAGFSTTVPSASVRSRSMGSGATPEPESIQVELRFADFDYCLEFGGAVQRHTPNGRLVRKGAPRPLGCPG